MRDRLSGTTRRLAVLGVAMLLGPFAAPGLAGAQTGNKNQEAFTDDFMMEACTFSSTGKNAYFNLTPGYRTVYRGEEDGETVSLTITVLNKTRGIGSTTTRVVEERETKGGQLVEVSRNYFAICAETDTVFYFGEDTDIYAGGVIVGHGGSWLHGVDGARAGVIMPGIVLLGSRYFQEMAPGVALDRAEHVGMHEVVTTPAGVFEDCVRVAETTPLEPKALEYKLYAPGVGLVQDDTLLLVSAGYVKLR